MPNPLAPRPILPIELIALDIDGTLIGDDLVIGPDTRAAVRGALDRGVVVSIVTGRMVSSAMRFAREMGLAAPVVGYQGGLIRAMPEPGSMRIGRLLYHRPIQAATAREIVEWARDQGLDPHINHLERFILRADDPNADDYSAFMGARAELVADLPGSILCPVTKVLAVDVAEEALELARENAVGQAVADAIAFERRDLLAPASPPADGQPLFDLLLANLPYVRHDALDGLPIATSFEPRLALDGGTDGLAVIERLLVQLPEALADGGLALLEIGADQAAAIVERCALVLPGWVCSVETDLAGLPRVARIRRS